MPAADDLADTYAKCEPASREDGRTTGGTSRTATTVTARPQSGQRRHAGHSVKVDTDDNRDAKTNRRPERTSASRGRPGRQAGSHRRRRRETRNRQGESGAQERARGSAESSLGSAREDDFDMPFGSTSGARPRRRRPAGDGTSWRRVFTPSTIQEAIRSASFGSGRMTLAMKSPAGRS